jgi:hypothetical protein
VTARHPLVKELPSVLDTTGWDWQPFEPPGGARNDFWIASDRQGNKWLVKLRGSFRGYRELVFERLVQRIGWPCQSSVFAVLEADAPPLVGSRDLERTQLLTWFLPEHALSLCGPNCPLSPLKVKLNAPDVDPLEVLKDSDLPCHIAWPLSQILAPIFGGNEPAGWLVTIDHQAILIDGELMFSSEPSDVRETSWWQRPDGSPSRAGRRLTREVCKAVGSLTDADLTASFEIPEGIVVQHLWDLRPLVFKARDYARIYSAILAQETE